MAEFKDEFSQLFQSAFGRKIDSTFWNWLYINTPYKPVSEKMYRGGCLIGHTAFQPRHFQVNGELLKFGYSLSSMVDKGGMGNYAKLLDSAIKTAINENDVLYAFPNNNSVMFFERLFGWARFKDITTLRYSVTGDIEFPDSAVTEVTVIDGWYEKIEDFVACMSQKYLILSSRSKEALSWRYFESPRKYRLFVHETAGGIQGYIVMSLYEIDGDLICDIIDFLFMWPDVANYLLAKVNNISVANKAKYMEIWGNDQEYDAVLQQFGFEESDSVTNFLYTPGRSDIETIHERSNWFISRCDSDVY